MAQSTFLPLSHCNETKQLSYFLIPSRWRNSGALLKMHACRKPALESKARANDATATPEGRFADEAHQHHHHIHPPAYKNILLISIMHNQSDREMCAYVWSCCCASLSFIFITHQTRRAACGFTPKRIKHTQTYIYIYTSAVTAWLSLSLIIILNHYYARHVWACESFNTPTLAFLIARNSSYIMERRGIKVWIIACHFYELCDEELADRRMPGVNHTK